MNLPPIDRIEHLCVCGHDIWLHEDYDFDIHECTARDCKCWQFLDADDNPVIEGVHDK